MSDLDLNSIIQIDFPRNQFIPEETEKNIIVLHHTVSGKGGINVANWWASTPDRVATQIVIDWDGKIYQLYSSRFWAHHLGVKSSYLKKFGYDDYNRRNRMLNKQSIGIELNAWGGLINHENKWYPVRWDKKLRKNLPILSVGAIENVQVYDEPFRGFYGFEKYTDEQIESVRQLLVYWNNRYGIPLDYNEDMWDVSKNALDGNKGIWTHVSFRPDKSDCHPQPNLIEMLKSLK
jgi:N-acetyl-anhydromuramyl-L-alanine amidase AmpD